jgi:hypothetical protein
MIAPQMICAQCMDVPHIQLLRLVSSNPRDQCQLHLATEIGHRAYAATRIASRWAWAQLPPHHPRTHDADAAYTRRDHRLRYEDLRCRIERKSSHSGVGQSTRCMFYHISNKSTHLPAKPTCCQMRSATETAGRSASSASKCWVLGCSRPSRRHTIGITEGTDNHRCRRHVCHSEANALPLCPIPSLGVQQSGARATLR